MKSTDVTHVEKDQINLRIMILNYFNTIYFLFSSKNLIFILKNLHIPRDSFETIVLKVYKHYNNIKNSCKMEGQL